MITKLYYQKATEIVAPDATAVSRCACAQAQSTATMHHSTGTHATAYCSFPATVVPPAGCPPASGAASREARFMVPGSNATPLPAHHAHALGDDKETMWRG